MNTIILGVGNLLCGDEGVGIHVIRELENQINSGKIKLHEGVDLLDGGTAGIDLLPIILSCKKMIMIDAVNCGGKAGSIFRFTPDDIKVRRENHISLHQVNIIDVINIAKKLKKKIPEIIIFGIQMKSMEYSLELSKSVKKGVPKIIDLILKELITDNSHT